MKKTKRLVWAAAVLLVTLLAGCASADDDDRGRRRDRDRNYIGGDRAKAIALDHAGVSENQARHIEVDLDRDDGRAVYEIEFHTDDAEYEYEIDASSGRILEYERESERRRRKH